MKKYTYIPPQILKRRVWTIATAQCLTSVNCFISFFMQNHTAILVPGIIFLLLAVATLAAQLPERSTKGDVFGSWILALLLPSYMLFSKNALGIWLFAGNMLVLAVDVFILYRPFRRFRK